MEIPRLGFKSELQLLACTTVTSAPDLRCVSNLYQSSRQHQIPNALSEARDRACILMDTSWVCYHWDTMGTPGMLFSNELCFSSYKHALDSRSHNSELLRAIFSLFFYLSPRREKEMRATKNSLVYLYHILWVPTKEMGFFHSVILMTT